MNPTEHRPSDPAPPLLGTHLELEAGVQTKAVTKVFRAAAIHNG